MDEAAAYSQLPQIDKTWRAPTTLSASLACPEYRARTRLLNGWQKICCFMCSKLRLAGTTEMETDAAGASSMRSMSSNQSCWFRLSRCFARCRMSDVQYEDCKSRNMLRRKCVLHFEALREKNDKTYLFAPVPACPVQSMACSPSRRRTARVQWFMQSVGLAVPAVG
jgi:hypothetical protein